MCECTSVGVRQRARNYPLVLVTVPETQEHEELPQGVERLLIYLYPRVVPVVGIPGRYL